MSGDEGRLPFSLTGDGTPFGTEIKVDGRPVTTITALAYEISADSAAVLTLISDFVPAELEAMAEVRFIPPQETADLIRELAEILDSDRFDSTARWAVHPDRVAVALAGAAEWLTRDDLLRTAPAALPSDPEGVKG